LQIFNTDAQNKNIFKILKLNFANNNLSLNSNKFGKLKTSTGEATNGRYRKGKVGKGQKDIKLQGLGIDM
jgi:hypothetical protein